jgi:hypothetical protein
LLRPDVYGCRDRRPVADAEHRSKEQDDESQAR